MEDLSVRKEAPVRRKSSDCSPKQLPRRSASPGGIIVSMVRIRAWLVMCEKKKRRREMMKQWPRRITS